MQASTSLDSYGNLFPPKDKKDWLFSHSWDPPPPELQDMKSELWELTVEKFTTAKKSKNCEKVTIIFMFYPVAEKKQNTIARHKLSVYIPHLWLFFSQLRVCILQFWENLNINSQKSELWDKKSQLPFFNFFF